MVVVADTSPLNYLILIGHVRILPELYGIVVIPQAVLRELQHSETPASVARWIADPPPWLQIRSNIAIRQDGSCGLDAGELEAISLAESLLPNVLLLIDENLGREEAEKRRIKTTGTLGVLDQAAAAKLLNLPQALEALLNTNFHVNPKLIQRLLDGDARRASKRNTIAP